jgi:hypothetical protein
METRVLADFIRFSDEKMRKNPLFDLEKESRGWRAMPN